MLMLLLFMIHTGITNYVHGMLAFDFFAIFFYQKYRKGKMEINALLHSEIWTLLLFGVTYVLFGEISTLYLEYYLIAPVLTFLAGWFYCESHMQPCEALHKAVHAIVLGFGVHIALNVLINIGNTRLEMRDFYRGLRIATGSGALNTMIFSLAMYALFLAEKFERIPLLLLLGLSAVYCLMLGTRTQILIFIFVFICMYGLYAFEKEGILGVRNIVGVLATTILVAFFIYKMDAFGIGTAINQSNLMKRFVINEYSGVAEAHESSQMRVELIINAFGEIAKHPFGGNGDAKYYHNMILDIARISGIIPMAIMLVYMFKMLRNLIKIYRYKELAEMRYMILSVYMGFWLNFAVEPVMEGLIEHFLLLCMLDGMITYITRCELPKIAQCYE